MRNNCSNLKCDLFVKHLSETNLFVYCNVPEIANHYCFHCTQFTNELLLFGSEAWTAEQNIELVEAVHKGLGSQSANIGPTS